LEEEEEEEEPPEKIIRYSSWPAGKLFPASRGTRNKHEARRIGYSCTTVAVPTSYRGQYYCQQGEEAVLKKKNPSEEVNPLGGPLDGKVALRRAKALLYTGDAQGSRNGELNTMMLMLLFVLDRDHQ
jgi:hypothetical protein